MEEVERVAHSVRGTVGRKEEVVDLGHATLIHPGVDPYLGGRIMRKSGCVEMMIRRNRK